MIRFGDNSYIEYTYSGSGEKLSVNYGVHYLPVLSPTGGDSSLSQESETLDDRSGDFNPEPFDNRISYCGNVVYDFGTTRLLTDEGYVTFDELTGTPQYHFYLRDHLGNNRVVMAQDGSLEQVTHYYTFAFGRLFLAMAESMRASLYSFGLSKKFGGVIRESTNPGLQPYKFGGKELDRTSGLDAYDFGARMYFPDRLQWGLMDPMCEKYYDWSPYVYCINRPLNVVDPDGRKIRPSLYRNVTANRSPIPILYTSTNSFVEAMRQFGETSYGKEFISSFLPKGQSQYGVSGNGKYSDVLLEIQEIDFDNSDVHWDFMKNTYGEFGAKVNDGILYIIVKIDVNNRSVEEIFETITHELALHGSALDEIVQAFRSEGDKSKNVSKVMMKDYRGKYAHQCLMNHNYNHPGVRNY